jgi:hypothetical protein
MSPLQRHRTDATARAIPTAVENGRIFEAAHFTVPFYGVWVCVWGSVKRKSVSVGLLRPLNATNLNIVCNSIGVNIIDGFRHSFWKFPAMLICFQLSGRGGKILRCF